MSGFSSILKLTDLDDFIAPSQECIIPVKSEKPKANLNSKVKIELEDGDLHNLPEEPKKAVQITLADCLACSGCVTSAESVLIFQQSPDEVLRYLTANKTSQANGENSLAVISLSVQSVLSLANKFDVDALTAGEILSGFFKQHGADKVVTLTIAENLSLIESGREFLERYQNEPEKLPIISGLCPGWVCYAEKLHPYSLPHISKVKSPQQIMGSLLKLVHGPQIGLTPDQIIHISVMPCFDRKLESSRKDFQIDDYQSKEVEVVITPVEFEQLLDHLNIKFLECPRAPLDNIFNSDNNVNFMRHLGSGSGGFAEHVMRYAASQLNEKEIDEVDWKIGRNMDISSAELKSENGRLTFSIATGFRNIQNLVRKLKLKNKQGVPHYIEMMACPSGCLNGGAQTRPDSLQGRELSFKLMDEYNKLDIEENLEEIWKIFPVLRNNLDLYSRIVYTEFHAIEVKTSGMNW